MDGQKLITLHESIAKPLIDSLRKKFSKVGNREIAFASYLPLSDKSFWRIYIIKPVRINESLFGSILTFCEAFKEGYCSNHSL